MNNSTAEKITLTLIGCGKMGSAMVHGWLNADIIDHIYIYDPYPIDAGLSDRAQVSCYKAHDSISASLNDSDMLILAVKPQSMPDLLNDIKPHIPEELTALSVAAGLPSSFFTSLLSSSQPFVRVMPNTPCAIGQGMSGLFANEHVTDKTKHYADTLFNAIGKTLWIDNETQMDAITAVSGSGPAYLFHFVEALASAAEDIGFDPDNAMKLARQTITGSAALLDAEKDIDASKLRQNVTSPGGTTEAGLNMLMGNKALETLVTETVQAALERGQELGQTT